MIDTSEASNTVIKFLTDNGYNPIACANVKILPMIMLRWLSNEITDEEALNYLDKLNIINSGNLRIVEEGSICSKN